MDKERDSTLTVAESIVFAVLFVAVGAAIIIGFNPWGSGPLLGKITDYLAKLGVSALLLVAALLARRSARWHRFWQVLFGLFILAVTISLQWIFGIHLGSYLGVKADSPAAVALAKLNECLVVAGTVITLTLLSGGSLGSLYIQKGNLRLGLTIGLIAIIVCVAGAIPMAGLMFRAQGLTVARVLPWIPWVLIAVLANAALEELLFRGLFLQNLQPLVGRHLAVWLIALVFTVLHRGAFYTPQEYVFLAVVFPLALAWGYVMQKTDGIWASILFHAGTDIPIFLGIFANLR
jgi:hypothetical protein